MRLSQYEIACIKELAVRHFGADVAVFLFGSRTNDRQRGGDIDLFIRGGNLSIHTKLNFLTDLVLKIGEQKIDVVLDKPDSLNPVFLKSIYQTGIQL